MKKATRAVLLLLLAISVLRADPARWEKDIKKFEAAADEHPVKEGGLLFVGSSSIRLWDLKSSFPGCETINHGFGGSELEDSIHFADRIIIPFRPSVVFLYAGDNDIGGGKTGGRVVDDFKKFTAVLRKDLPGTRIVFLPIKPSLSRWDKWTEMKKANDAIEAITQKDPLLDYLDTVSPMLGNDGKPKPTLFRKDGLHLNVQGYQVWTKVVSTWLKTTAKAKPSDE